MNDSDFLTVMVGLLVIGVGCFAMGKSTGDDYWHKPCNQYSVAAYSYQEVPARCIK